MNDTDAVRSAGRELDAAVAERVFGWRWYTWVESGERALFQEPPEEYPVREVARALGQPENPGHRWIPSTGEEPVGGNPAPGYSTEIAGAWGVHRAMCARRFSVRRRYLRALQEQVQERTGSSVAWPDVLVFLQPADFCRAALAALAAPIPDAPETP